MTRQNSPTAQRIYASCGIVIEWFDFTLFAALAPTIGPLFFPASDPVVSMIGAFGVFAAGYLVRPFGGILLGKIGDTRGRRAALITATLLMVIPMLGTVLLPTYAVIGLWAPILLTLFRLIQGFSVGGEFSGALAALSETGGRDQRGRSVSLGLMMSMAGLLLSSVVAWVTSMIWGEDDLAHGTWRVPFVFGLLLAIVAFFLQRRMNETEAFVEVEQSGVEERDPRSPLKILLQEYKIPLLRMFALGVWSAVTVYGVMVWLPTYIQDAGDLGQQTGLLISSSMSTLYILVVLPIAILGDRVGRRRLLLVASGAYLALSVPLFMVAGGGVLPLMGVACAILVVLQTIVDTGTTTEMAGQVPSRVRHSGLAISYNIAMIAGGFTPLIAESIVGATGSATLVGVILVIIAAVEIPVVLAAVKRTGVPSTDATHQ